MPHVQKDSKSNVVLTNLAPPNSLIIVHKNDIHACILTHRTRLKIQFLYPSNVSQFGLVVRH